MTKRAVVIGAGLGGLATAALLGKDGWEVTVVEKNDGPGGRAGVWRKDGFLFDLGPSWYLMPEAFERYFSLHGLRASDLLRLVRLDPQFRVFYGGGDTYDVRDRLSDNAALFDRLEPGGAAKTERYLAKAREQYDPPFATSSTASTTASPGSCGGTFSATASASACSAASMARRPGRSGTSGSSRSWSSPWSS